MNHISDICIQYSQISWPLLSDDKDIEQLENLELYAQGNTLAKQFHMCASFFVASHKKHITDLG